MGGAFGYARDARHDTESDLRAPLVSATKDYWLLSPRIGYLLQPLPAFAFWPRAGVTLLMPGHANTRNNAAVSLELPLIGLLPGVPVGISATPHFDLGFSPAHEGKLSELGLSFAAHVFF